MLLTDYNEEYDEKIKKLDAEMFYEIKSHKDIVPGSVCVALKNGVFAGVGLLMATPAFAKQVLKKQKDNGRGTAKKIGEDDYNIEEDQNKKVSKTVDEAYYINGEYKAVPGTEYEIETSVNILDDMKESLRLLKTEHRDKSLAIRLFCNGTDLAYMEFLIANGFDAVGIMPVFSKKLLYEKKSGKQVSINNLSYDNTLIEGTGVSSTEKYKVCSLRNNRELYKEYLNAFKSAFKSPQSRNELEFRLTGDESDVLCLTADNKILASVSFRRKNKDTVIIENLFCIRKYRNKGFATDLLRYLEEKLKEAGVKRLELMVEGDNHPAVMLYVKNGFELTGTSVVMKYEIR
ncbi:MAG: GNAT family N-acetyltransferase [Lachnospiraceae bacterium]|nr:GNAT family N-acetyltransferase [Lachnospiraceae bacterium]